MIAVTGARGFIGNKIFHHFVPKDVVVTTDIGDCFNFVQDFGFQHITELYHCGAISSTTETDINKIHKYNVEFSIKLFEKCIQHGIPVKYTSSASVFGNSEYHAINPLNYYAMSKATVDLWIADNFDRFKSIQVFRLYNVYGNGEDHKGTQASPITQFTKQAKKGEICVFEGSGDFIRDFVCVEDVVNVMTSSKKESGFYDVGTGYPISFQKVAELIQAKYGGTIKTIPFPKHLERKYQFYTKARKHFDYRYRTVEQWLLENSGD